MTNKSNQSHISSQIGNTSPLTDLNTSPQKDPFLDTNDRLDIERSPSGHKQAYDDSDLSSELSEINSEAETEKLDLPELSELEKMATFTEENLLKEEKDNIEMKEEEKVEEDHPEADAHSKEASEEVQDEASEEKTSNVHTAVEEGEDQKETETEKVEKDEELQLSQEDVEKDTKEINENEGQEDKQEPKDEVKEEELNDANSNDLEPEAAAAGYENEEEDEVEEDADEEEEVKNEDLDDKQLQEHEEQNEGEEGGAEEEEEGEQGEDEDEEEEDDEMDSVEQQKKKVREAELEEEKKLLEAEKQRIRLEAKEDLTLIEIEYAKLKDVLYHNQLKRLEYELALCLNGSHPDFIRILNRINENYDRKIKTLVMAQNYKLDSINKQTKGTRFLIHQQYLKNCHDFKMKSIEETTTKWYEINKERRMMDQIPPPGPRKRKIQAVSENKSVLFNDIERLNKVQKIYGFPSGISNLGSAENNEIEDDLAAMRRQFLA